LIRAQLVGNGFIQESVDAVALGVLEGGESARSMPGRSIKKNRQFLADSAGTWYCFSEIPISG